GYVGRTAADFPEIISALPAGDSLLTGRTGCNALKTSLLWSADG
ncbi:hypothetical protein GBF38_000085, partial [Nibea albiflora]